LLHCLLKSRRRHGTGHGRCFNRPRR
jgi:hypothetical protein